jgi:hypothetical protein
MKLKTMLLKIGRIIAAAILFVIAVSLIVYFIFPAPSSIIVEEPKTDADRIQTIFKGYERQKLLLPMQTIDPQVVWVDTLLSQNTVTFRYDVSSFKAGILREQEEWLKPAVVLTACNEAETRFLNKQGVSHHFEYYADEKLVKRIVLAPDECEDFTM